MGGEASEGAEVADALSGGVGTGVCRWTDAGVTGLRRTAEAEEIDGNHAVVAGEVVDHRLPVADRRTKSVGQHDRWPVTGHVGVEPAGPGAAGDAVQAHKVGREGDSSDENQVTLRPGTK